MIRGNKNAKDSKDNDITRESSKAHRNDYTWDSIQNTVSMNELNFNEFQCKMKVNFNFTVE